MTITDYDKNIKVDDPAQIAGIMYRILQLETEEDRDKEHFWVIGLTGSNRIKYIELVTLGLLNMSLVHPREVFRHAITQAVQAIICVHNHPGQDTNPSQQDIEVATQLIQSGRVLGIPVIDNMIIAKGFSVDVAFNSYLTPGEIPPLNIGNKTVRTLARIDGEAR